MYGKGAPMGALRAFETGRSDPHARPLRRSDIVVRFAIVGLTLATGYIHATLGGPLFTLNAIGYGVAAIALVAPFSLAIRFRWFIRLGLMGYAAATIVGWYVMGPRYDVAYLAKAIEIALIVLVAIDFRRMDRSLPAAIRHTLHG